MKHSYAEITDAVVSATNYSPRSNGNFRCPAHDDKNASLSISAGRNGEVLLHCFAGCSFESIMDAIGLNGVKRPPADPWRNTKHEKKVQHPVDFQNLLGDTVSMLRSQYAWLLERDRFIYPHTLLKIEMGFLDRSLVRKHGLSEAFADRFVFPARDIEGRLVGIKLHRSTPDQEPKALSLPGSKTGLFICGDLKSENPVLACEGELDAVSLFQATGFTALSSTGGATRVDFAWSKVFEGHEVIVFHDEDPPGEACRDRWISVLKPMLRSGRIRSLKVRGSLPPGLKDVSDCLQADRLEVVYQALSSAVEVADTLTAEEEPSGLCVVEEGGLKEIRIVPLSTPLTKSDLLAMQIAPTEFKVEGLLVPGLTLLVGKPKHGKSFLAMQLAEALSTGTKFLDRFQVKSQRVVYLTLEDSHSRLHDRLAILGANGEGEDIIFRDRIRQGLEGLRELAAIIEADNPGVVIIDTIQRMRGSAAGRGESVYAADYAYFSDLKAVADKYRVSIVGVHHLRKGLSTDDPFEAVSGSNGVLGSADACWILSRHGEEGVFHTRGRD